ncbi:AAA family ATPase [Rhizorhabdus histidinilytica]|uniref:AAA family ATPase n=1 Tax=Rhizorhabdus histidinilytica TaxID=439228 RepID=UPI00321F97CA
MSRAAQEMTPVDWRGDPGSARGDLEAEFGALGVIVMPGDAESPILTPPVRGALHQWLFEMNSEAELKAVGLKPRSRALLSGPPGCGKTTLAHHICARLGVPMVVIQSSEMIGKYLGESGRNIGKIFRSARRNSYDVALFFDEFDALAKKREDLGTQGADNERSNITIALLQEFDRYEGLLFAATNVTKDIDPAIWRRFQLQIEIGLPGIAERFAICRLYLAPYDVADQTVTALADAFAGASPALIREGCESIKRALVLGPRMSLPTDLRSIVQRFAASASASEGMPEPALWADQRNTLATLADCPWPPELAS